MAERRSLHRKVSVSEDLAALREAHGGDAVAFWLMCIPHMDRWGCVPEKPHTLRALVVPMWPDVTADTVKKWILWMVRRGMFERVEGPGGQRGLRAPAFAEHQAGHRFDRERPSPYEPEEVTERWSGARRGKAGNAGESRTGPGRVRPSSRTRPSEVKRSEEKGRTPPPPTAGTDTAKTNGRRRNMTPDEVEAAAERIEAEMRERIARESGQ